MLAGLPLAFANPMVLAALLALPVIWYLLRLTPPRPRDEVFPPLAILERLLKREETPSRSPWWLTLLRLAMAALVILAMAGPTLNPREPVLSGEGAVLLVIDDGWASGGKWDAMQARALEILDEAEAADRRIALIRTADPGEAAPEPLSAAQAASLLQARPNLPLPPDHALAAARVSEAVQAGLAGSAVFLSDGLDRNAASRELASSLSAAGSLTVTLPRNEATLALLPVANEPDALTGTVIASQPGVPPVRVTGYDLNGLPITSAIAAFEGTQTSAAFRFEAPVELRNQIARIAIAGTGNAGAVQLMDDGNRRRIVGLISGQSADISQPLLSPLFYIERALAPFSDIRQPDTANVGEAVGDLIGQGVSAIIMADIGNLPEETVAALTRWVEEGGMLIRFAGPRLAASPDTELLPVRLIQGDRFIGGALSWETPKSVAPFERNSPYFGLDTPSDVTVSRQVMAMQARGLDNRVWARLDDGTPLVTAAPIGSGNVVLFHVNSDNNWSNLPLSGIFVDMLRRTVNLSRVLAGPGAGEQAVRLPPMQVLDGGGNLVPPPVSVKPLVIEPPVNPQVSAGNHPGFYGTTDGFVALNLTREGTVLTPLDRTAFSAAQFAAYGGAGSLDLRPWLLALAALFFLADCLAVLWFAGSLRAPRGAGIKRPATAGAALAALAASLMLMGSSAPVLAQENASPDVDFAASLQTRFAFVRTGLREIDDVSEAGLTGLTRYMAARTALEAGEPVGVDIASDELAFYPFLYWPIHADAPLPDATAMARVDAYMKQGGTILFDTRDRISGLLSSGGASPETRKLRELLASLDIPPLEPVPPDHVLTKAFYLLNTFPGRYQGGDLWVEQIGTAEERESRPARAGDGVSTILITGNDFAGAWAVDDANRSLFPTIPDNPLQREYAFRTGVNIVMYTLTGNYKADQVHIPALLERLGQ